MAAAFELCHQNADVDITVYQLGHRLGGKGASGRRADQHQRIEEHGLHAFSGIYENAFFVLRQAYAALRRDPTECPLASWQDAFKPCRKIYLHEEVDGAFVPWVLDLPTNRELPGETGASWWLGANSYLGIAFDFWKILNEEPAGDVSGEASIFGSWTSLSRWLFEQTLSESSLTLLTRLLRPILQRRFEQVRLDPKQTSRRREFIALNFLYGNIRGFVAANALTKGLDGLDEYDYCEWLQSHVYPDFIDGKSLTASSPLARFVYDAQFSFVDGDIRKPRFAAGAALRTLIRMALSWKGAVIWKMQAGMGDVVFAPLYQYLKQRGVTFRFFHRLENIELSEDTHIRQLNFAVQARTLNGEYQPLVNVLGVPSWPSEPLLEQLDLTGLSDTSAHGFESLDSPAQSTLCLRSGVDFDAVVLGTSIGMLPHVARELVSASKAWSQSVHHVRTVQTQASQLWTQETAEAERADQGAIGICYNVGRLNTYASMHHLLARETWPKQSSGHPSAVWYLCGVHDESSLQQPPDHDTRTFVAQHLNALAPGPRTIVSQFIAPAPNPSDRFVQSLPGSSRFRLSPAEAHFGNLFIAGDWTRTGFNMGNAEAATMSGRRCARALLKHLGLRCEDTPIVGEQFL